jgi:DNA-directed RNA polymerase specialized sigma24 family protein
LTNRPAFISDEELVKQLQAALRVVRPEGSPGPDDEQARTARGLAEELAERIYREPATWGLANVPPEFRDDAASDAFTALLFAIPEMRGRQGVAEWFSVTVESKFRRLWTLAERQAVERKRLAVEAAENPAPEPPSAAEPEPDAEQSMFEEPEGTWTRFETAFPRDAFALRLRYLLKRDLEEMAVMLDAPSSRAITMRLDRARDRFRMYCEQVGVGRRELQAMLDQLAEEPAS